MLTLTQINERRVELADELEAIDATAKDGALNATQSARVKEITDEFDKLKEQEPTAKKLDEIRNSRQPSGQSTNSVRPPLHAQPKSEPDPKFGFRDIHDQLQTIRQSTMNRQLDNRLKPLIQNAAGGDEHHTQNDPFGGFFVVPSFLPSFLQLDPEGDPTDGLVQNVPMESPIVRIRARTDKDHSTSVSGGLRVYRRAETQAVASSRTETEMITLTAEYLDGVAYASEELLNDSAVSFTAILEAGMRQEFASKKFKEKIDGTGVGQFEGVLNSPAKLAVAKEGSQAADTILGANIVKMKQRAYNYNNSVWIANHDTLTQLITTHISGTNGDYFLFRPGSTIPGTTENQSVDIPDQLLGRPIYFTEYAKTLGDEGDLMLVDWSQYLMGTMIGGPQMRSSIHVRFLNHENTFMFYERNDARCWWRSPLTPVNSSETLSPIVTLAARA